MISKTLGLQAKNLETVFQVSKLPTPLLNNAVHQYVNCLNGQSTSKGGNKEFLGNVTEFVDHNETI